ncbi:MAG: acetyl/propionyl/methylcrotonyl-CoA carboxylase subunit alpha [Planctomycetota bacterium]
MTIRKVLVANRGEIALRVIRTLREMGIGSVAVFSEADRRELHVRAADEAYPIGPAAPVHSYLRIDRLVETARAAGCDAVHPGYGFLSENPGFARAVEEAGLVFVGPSPETIEQAGDKLRAREAMEQAGVPVVPGGAAARGDPQALRRVARRAHYPLMLKAVGGGGGKGIRIVRRQQDLAAAFERASSEAAAAFGNPDLYVERLLKSPRHVEVQIVADRAGNTVHLGERECSIQRRHQKLLEETPAPRLDPGLRARMGEAAVSAARAVRYRGAGTIEFLVEGKSLYFLEMNTRIQVEHPITELCYGVDLVRLQLEIAAGRPLPFRQEELRPQGHAVEVRLTAEDPEAGFLPVTGRVASLRFPQGPGIRVDSHLYLGQELNLHYDPMLGKVIAWGADRREAIDRLHRALVEMRIVGVRTCAPLLRALLRDAGFVKGGVDTTYLERFAQRSEWRHPPRYGGLPAEIPAVLTAVLHAHRQQGRVRTALCDRARERPDPWLEAGRRAALNRGAGRRRRERKGNRG